MHTQHVPACRGGYGSYVCVYGPLTLGVSCVDECSGRLLFYLLHLLRRLVYLLLLLLQYNKLPCPQSSPR